MGEDPATFEQSLADLEERVRALEGGEIPLDQALKLFEEGVALARTCHEQLEAAEVRVAALSRGAEGIEETPISE
jgi:exodeoxyribonuclease VII small subunit